MNQIPFSGCSKNIKLLYKPVSVCWCHSSLIYLHIIYVNQNCRNSTTVLHNFTFNSVTLDWPVNKRLVFKCSLLNQSGIKGVQKYSYVSSLKNPTEINTKYIFDYSHKLVDLFYIFLAHVWDMSHSGQHMYLVVKQD